MNSSVFWEVLDRHPIFKAVIALLSYIFIGKTFGQINAYKLWSYLQTLLKIPTLNPIIPIIFETSKRSGTYIDVGAQWGDTLIPVSGFFDKCVAIEPDPRSLRLLRLVRPFIPNLVCIGMALGDKSNTSVELFLQNQLRQSSLYIRSDSAIKVQMTTLDEIVRRLDLKPPFLIKLDVEGAEYGVLKGAEQTLRHQCELIVEIWPQALKQAGISPLDLFKIMEDKGYTAYTVDNRPLTTQMLRKMFKEGTEIKIPSNVIFRRT